MSVLETRDVFYSYTKGSMILSGINAVFETGKLHAILGPSGSGKTTLLSLLGELRRTPPDGCPRCRWAGNKLPSQDWKYLPKYKLL